MDKNEREKFVLDNKNLVYSVAHEFKSRCNGCVGWDDIVQSGMMGLLQAVDKFDPEKGYQFSTYATWWIEREIRRCLSSDVPEYVNGKAGKIIHQVNKLEDAGEEATPEKIAEGVALPEKVIKNALPRLLGDVHLDAKVSNDSDASGTFGDYLNFDEEGVNDPEQIIFKKLDSEALSMAIRRIPKKAPPRKGNPQSLGRQVYEAYCSLPPRDSSEYADALSDYARLYDEWLATQEIDEVAGDVMYDYYFERLTLKLISQKQKCSKQNIDQKRGNALEKLKMDPLILATQV